MIAYGFLLLSILLTLCSQVLQKQVADNRPQAQTPLKQQIFFYFYQGRLWVAMALLFIAMLSWLVVLDAMEVGKAFPFLSINYVLMLLVSRKMFSEIIPPTRWLGSFFIVVGILFIAGS